MKQILLIRIMIIAVILIIFSSLPVFCQNIFMEVSKDAGINHAEHSYGASWGDFNGDEYPDLYVNNHRGGPLLYKNNQDGTFTDVASSVGVYIERWDKHASSWVDFDNDGDNDLFVSCGANRGKGGVSNLLYVNHGGRFIEQAVFFGLDQPLARGRQPLWFDFKNDGYLDVLLTSTLRPDKREYSSFYGQEDGLFTKDDIRVNLDMSMVKIKTAFLADVTGDKVLDLIPSFDGTFPSRIYDVSSGVAFKDITTEPGFRSNSVVDAVFEDFDGDLKTDIIAARYTFEKQVITIGHDKILGMLPLSGSGEVGVRFKVEGEIRFILEPKKIHSLDQIYIGEKGVHPEDHEFTLSPDNPTNHGRAGRVKGVFINYDSQQKLWTVLHSNTEGYRNLNLNIYTENPVSLHKRVGFKKYSPTTTPKLFLKKGGKFTDVTRKTIFRNMLVSAQSVVAGDFDNDMDVDVYLVAVEVARNASNRLFLNNGDGFFTEVPGGGGASGSLEGKGDSAVTADYDLDGFLDLFIINGTSVAPLSPPGPHQLFKNIGNDNHWLEIDLEGVISNREGIGAFVYVTAGGKTQLRVQNGGMHHRSQNHTRLHFGLANNTIVEKIRVEWPGGRIQELKNLKADQLVKVKEECSAVFNNSIEVLNAPTSVKPADSYILNVMYECSENREIEVIMHGSDGELKGKGITTVTRGKGSTTVEVKMLNPLSLGTGYTWEVKLFPTGGMSSEVLDELNIGDVTVK